MNYNIRLCGLINESFDVVARLIIESAKEADYMVRTYSSRVLAPASTIMLDMQLVGSAHKDPIDIVLDLDDVYCAEPVELHISPIALDLPKSGTYTHYWGVAGSLFRVVSDLSPAYVTSYLLDANMNTELAIFKQHTMTSLPLYLQEVIAMKIG
jgi:hypothetical protein